MSAGRLFFNGQSIVFVGDGTERREDSPWIPAAARRIAAARRQAMTSNGQLVLPPSAMPPSTDGRSVGSGRQHRGGESIDINKNGSALLFLRRRLTAEAIAFMSPMQTERSRRTPVLKPLDRSSCLSPIATHFGSSFDTEHDGPISLRGAGVGVEK